MKRVVSVSAIHGLVCDCMCSWIRIIWVRAFYNNEHTPSSLYDLLGLAASIFINKLQNLQKEQLPQPMRVLYTMIIQMIFTKHKYIITIFILLALTIATNCYIDIDLDIATSSADVALNMPVTINNHQYHIAVSLYNQEEFIVSPTVMVSSKKPKSIKPKEVKGVMHVSSLQGYTLQGWKRFFLQVALYEDSKYSHTISFDLSKIKQVDKKHPMTSGIMTVGPQLDKNVIFKMIKEETKDYFKQDIVSFYSTPGGKYVKMQLGGFEEQNARGYDNGVRFYEKPINKTTDGKGWILPVSKLVIAKEKSNRWDCYSIPSSAINPKLTIQSQFVILPLSMKQDLETSFESQNIECQFSVASNQLQCANMSSIDQALTFVSFYLDANVSINMSLYQLRDTYNNKDKVTSFFLKLGAPQEIQIGYPLLKGHYISLNMDRSTLLFSPLNRFTPQISTASILRFVVIFMLFMFVACIFLVIWQQCSTEGKAKRFSRSKDGLRLVAYQKPAQVQEQD